MIGDRAAADARDAVLARIRDALADGPRVVPVPRDYETSLASGIDIVALFAERVSDYRATVHDATPASLPEVVATLLASHAAHRLAVPVGIPEGWLRGVDVVSVGDDPPLTWDELDAIDGVITGCAVAIAETGTIVLDAGADQGRRALSLLPDLHVCVVAADRIVGSVPEALGRLDPTRPLTWISGPSATSDIELERVEGVHGPRRLDVIIVRPG
jgi:L-lactate dehydrogenase complex protein LldG